MSFSEKMRESLGAVGVRLRVTPTEGSLTPGSVLSARVDLEGGNAAAHIDALVLRLIEADRHWTDDDGQRFEEDDVTPTDARDRLTAGWERRPVAETRVAIDTDVEAEGLASLDVQLDIPAECKLSSTSCAHTLNVQADIKGQIDPTANARVIVAST